MSILNVERCADSSGIFCFGSPKVYVLRSFGFVCLNLFLLLLNDKNLFCCCNVLNGELAMLKRCIVMTHSVKLETQDGRTGSCQQKLSFRSVALAWVLCYILIGTCEIQLFALKQRVVYNYSLDAYQRHRKLKRLRTSQNFLSSAKFPLTIFNGVLTGMEMYFQISTNEQKVTEISGKS